MVQRKTGNSVSQESQCYLRQGKGKLDVSTLTFKGPIIVEVIYYYRKIPKIDPSMYKPLQLFTLKYKAKQSKNGKFLSNYKASPINFETQISLRR